MKSVLSSKCEKSLYSDCVAPKSYCAAPKFSGSFSNPFSKMRNQGRSRPVFCSRMYVRQHAERNQRSFLP